MNETEKKIIDAEVVDDVVVEKEAWWSRHKKKVLAGGAIAIAAIAGFFAGKATSSSTIYIDGDCLDTNDIDDVNIDEK